MENNFGEKIRLLKENADIVEIIGRYVTLNRKGSEFVGVCPFHHDHKPTLNVNKAKQLWTCPACGGEGGNNVSPGNRSSGDVFDFLLRHGLSWKEAIGVVSGGKTLGGPATKKANTPSSNKKPTVWTPIKSALPPSQIVHYRLGKPSNFWVYRDKDRQVLTIACRFDISDGSKEILPLTYCTNGKVSEWRWQARQKPRPLYNLDQLNSRPEATVLVVEGEKTADAAQKLYPHLVATTWLGGTNGVLMADWSPLENRNIALWPDNDKDQRYGVTHPLKGQIKPFHEQPGNAAMYSVAKIIFRLAKVVKWIRNAPEFPNKWDVADAKWSNVEALEYIKANIIPIPRIPKEAPPTPKEAEKEPIAGPGPGVPGPSAAEGHADEEKPAVAAQNDPPHVSPFDHKAYFQFLGFQKEGAGVVHCFFVKETRTCLKYSAGKLSAISTLIQLAPLDFWEGSFTVKRGGKIDINMAVNWLCRASHDKGFFDSNTIRGRGAWIDGGRVVLHSGSYLVVDGNFMGLGEINSRFVYEAGADLGFRKIKPLTVAEAHKILDIFQYINFDREVSKYILSGWCIVAPMCGALPWRSHVWITGSAGSGKSWVLQNILRPLLGKTAIAVQGETSEPGLRQMLGTDALPVVFDEAEGEDERSLQRMQSIMGLMRSSSAEDGGLVIKGAAGGSAMLFQIRSMFANASIGFSATQQSDKTRVTVVGLNSNDPNHPETKTRWESLQKAQAETITPDFVERLQARTIQMLPIILKNAKVFSAAAATVLGAQRLGDQVGTLLAGSYMLSSNNEITFEKAIEWVKDRKWDEEKSLDQSKDEIRLFQRILESLTKMDTGTKPVERSIGELVKIANQTIDDEAVTSDVAKKRLNRLGMDCDLDYIYFAINSSHLKSILYRTPWHVNYHKILQRLEGAEMLTAYFHSHGMPDSAIAIPFSIMGGQSPAKNPFDEPFDPNHKVITSRIEDAKPDDLPF